MGRANAPFRRLNQGREAFNVTRGTAGYSASGSTGIENGFAATTEYESLASSAWPEVSARGKTLGAVLINNPGGVTVSAVYISDDVVNFTASGASPGDVLTFWVF